MYHSHDVIIPNGVTTCGRGFVTCFMGDFQDKIYRMIPVFVSNRVSPQVHWRCPSRICALRWWGGPAGVYALCSAHLANVVMVTQTNCCHGVRMNEKGKSGRGIEKRRGINLSGCFKDPRVSNQSHTDRHKQPSERQKVPSESAVCWWMRLNSSSSLLKCLLVCVCVWNLRNVLDSAALWCHQSPHKIILICSSRKKIHF